MSPWTTDDVTLSTKCWEGDYRFVLSELGLERLLGSFGPAASRQVVVNRVQDRRHAEELGAGLVEAGLLDRVAFAEDHWPVVAELLGIPVTWFGAAWPYSVPELVELFLCQSSLLAHVAGDVGLIGSEPWLPRALSGFDLDPSVQVVSPGSPSGVESFTGGSDRRGEWVLSNTFSDQCFLAPRSALFSPTLVRATHWTSGRYPKPGGSLTFEARVGAWLATGHGRRASDMATRYVHPIHGTEGASYRESIEPWLPPVIHAGSAYPAAKSVDATGLIIVRNDERTIAAAVASLAWCKRVLVLDQSSEDQTAPRARAAGAEVWQMGVTGVVERARLEAVASIASGWVVMLEADELVTGPLAQELARSMSPDAEFDAVRIARKNMLFGRWARGSGWWPDPQLRVFKAESVILPNPIHGSIALATGARSHDLVPAAERLPELALLHFNHNGYADWFDRMNRYTSVDAREAAIERAHPGVAFARSFLRRFLRERGWRLGRYGFDLSVMGASYDWLLVQKAVEYARGGETAIDALYDDIARDLLEGPGR